MDFKIDKNLQNDLNNIAESEYSTAEGVLIRGLIIYTKYLKKLDLTGFFKGKKGIEEAEKYIIALSKEYNESINEVVFGCIDAYRAKILGLNLRERLSASGRDDAYMFLDDFFRGPVLSIYNKGYSVNELDKVMKKKYDEIKMGYINEIKGYITAEEKKIEENEKILSEIDKELKQAEAQHATLKLQHEKAKVKSRFSLSPEKILESKRKEEALKKEADKAFSDLEMIRANWHHRDSKILESMRKISYLKNVLNNFNEDINISRVREEIAE